MSKEYEGMYGQVIAEMRRRKYTAKLLESGLVRVGIADITLVDCELDEEDLENPLKDVCDNIEESIKAYLANETEEELPKEIQMNPVVAQYIRRKNITDRSKRLLESDPNQLDKG